MPIIDSEELKRGLQAVQAADLAHRRAVEASQAATPQDRPVALAHAEQAEKAFERSLLELYGCAEALVNLAEGRRYDQNE